MAKQDDDNHDGRLKRKEYGKELSRLQEELCKLQDWIKYKGLRASSNHRLRRARRCR